MSILKHDETIEDYPFQLPFEADKSKSIQEMTLDELQKLNRRLRLERETEQVILDLKRNSGERWDYEQPPPVDTKTPVNLLYHHGVMGMKWGVRKDRQRPGVTTGKSQSQKPPASDDHKESRTFKAKATSGLSTAELRRLNERLDLERRYKDLTKNEKKRGKALAEDIMSDIAKKSITTVGTAVATYGLAKLAGNFVPSEALQNILKTQAKNSKKSGGD